MKVLLSFAAILVVLLVVGVSYLGNPIHPYTEIYFENGRDLPTSIGRSETVPFTFIIHNREGVPMQYRYEVRAEYAGTSQTLLTKTAVVQSDEYQSIFVNLSINAPFDKAKIVVELAHKNQDIHFWVTQR